MAHYNRSTRHKVARFVAVILLMSGALSSLRAQARFLGLGLRASSFNSHLDVSPDGKYVVGTSMGIDDLPVIWSEATGVQPMSNQERGFGIAVIDDGAAACISVWRPGGVIGDAFYWTPSTGPMALGFLPGNDISWCSDISDDGSVIAGISASLVPLEQQAVIWTVGGAMTGLGTLPLGEGSFSWAWGVSGDGNVVVGYSNGANGQEAFRWSEGTMEGLGALPGATASQAYGASYDGSVIVGRSSTASGLEATMWSGGSVIGLGLLPGAFISVAWDVSGDGSIVVGHSSAAFIWDAVNGMRDMKQVLENEYGLDLTGWKLDGALRTSHDGKVIVGWGRNPEGNEEAWLAEIETSPVTVISPVTDERLGALTEHNILWASAGVDSLRIEFSDDDGATYALVEAAVPADSNLYRWEVPATTSDSCRIKLTDVADSDVFAVSNRFRIGDAIVITHPQAGERWIAGEQDTIRWETFGIDSIRILFSREFQDLNSPFDTLAVDYPAESGFFAWDIPEDMLSAKCGIVIDDMKNPFIFSAPRRFRIKGYVLTRFKADSTYEAFDPAVHGWSFGNGAQNMWPDTWYNRFDYTNGTDPFTGQEYPFWFTFWPYNAQPSDFPDWPLFVSAFGTEQCYISDTGNASYRLGATNHWNVVKGPWAGSCFGFSTSTFLAFDRKEIFRAVYPDLPEFNNTFDLSVNEATRTVINELMIQQYGKAFKDHYRANRSKRAVQTLNEIKAMLLSETRDNRPIIISDNTPVTGGAHAINPYKVEIEPLNQDIEYVYVYDNNAPGRRDRKIIVDKTADAWDYRILNNWGGKPEEGKSFYLNLPVSAYLSNAILPGSSVSVQPAALAKLVTNESYITTYHSEVTSILLTNRKGEQIGFSPDAVTESVPDATPLVPITGYPHLPIGYDLPADAYTVGMQGHAGPSSYLSVMTDTLSLTFGYTDADSALSDHLHIDGGLAVCYTDQRTKTSNFQAIVIEAQSERAFDITTISSHRTTRCISVCPTARIYGWLTWGVPRATDCA